MKNLAPFSTTWIDAIPLPVLLLNRHCAIRYANCVAQQLLERYSEQDLQALQDEITGMLALCLETGRMYKMKLVTPFAQSYRYYEAAVSVLSVDDDAEGTYLMVLRDITAASIADQFLFSRVNRLSRVANLAPVGETVASTANLLRFWANYLVGAFPMLGCAFVTFQDDLPQERVCVAAGLSDAHLSTLCAAAEELYERLENRFFGDLTTLVPDLKMEGRPCLLAWRMGVAYRIKTLALVFLPDIPLQDEILDGIWQTVEEMSASLAQACLLDRLEYVMQQRVHELERANLGLRSQVAERERIEQKLLAERNFNSIILDTMDALVIVIDRQGYVVRVNRAFERFLGYSSGDMVQKRVWEFLIQSQDSQVLQDLLANIQVGLSPFQFANHWVTKEGQERTIAWTSSTLTDANRDAQYIVAIGIDITDQKQIERLLERERILLRGLMDSIPDLIFYKDTQGVYLGWNAAFEAQNRLKFEGHAAPYRDEDLYAPELAERFRLSDQQVLSSGKPLIYENWTEHPPLLVETHKTPYYGPDGELIGVIGVVRDITKHRLAEEALRKANREIEQLIASLSSLLIVISPMQEVLRWNPTAEKVLGLSASDVIGKQLIALQPVLDWETLRLEVDNCHGSHPIYLDPLRFRRVDGSEGVLGMSVSPMFGDENQLNGYIILGADITERQILESRLAQARNLESIGQLAAGIAHEINTPIQYIGDNTHFLKQAFEDLLKAIEAYRGFALRCRGQGDAVLAECASLEMELKGLDLEYLTLEIPAAVEQTLEGVQRVSEIVRAMKSFSHGGLRKKAAININKSLQDTLSVTRNEWKYIATIETDFVEDLPNVVCIAGEINQVFLNVIMNGVDAIRDVVGSDGQQKGVLRLGTRQVGDWVEVRIADSGTGIPEAVRSRVFEPFFTTKEVGKGTGQGLAIAYDIIVIKHKGDLSFETELGKGTTFIIRLPIHPSADLDQESNPQTIYTQRR